MFRKILIFLILSVMPVFASQSLQLTQGWNLKGSYLDNIDMSQFDNDNISTVWKWDNGQWQIYSPDSAIDNIIANYNLSAISLINAGDGFWVNAKKSDNITLSGNSPADSDIIISNGWQLLSLKGEVSFPISKFNNDNISTVWKWGSGQWEVYSPDTAIANVIATYNLAPISEINSGEGFWVKGIGDATVTPPSLTFIAVDPYIEGAVFFEDKNGNGVPDDGEQFSTPSDDNGTFTFETPPSPTSVITMIEQGTEDGEAFDGIIKTNLDMCDDTTNQCVASPLTTLVANGLTKQEIVDILSKAGINITVEDFNKNPMKGLKNKVVSSLANDDFSKLQANMMLSGFMNILKKLGKSGFSVTYDDFDNDTINQYLKPIADLVKNVLNKGILSQMKSDMNSQMPSAGGTSLPPVTADVLIKAANSVMHYVTKKAVEEIENGENVDFNGIQSMIADKTMNLAKKYYAVMNADKFSSQAGQSIKQIAGIYKLEKGIKFFISDNGSINSVGKNEFLKFKSEDIADTVLLYTGKLRNKIIKFYDNNTVKYYEFNKVTKEIKKNKGTWLIDDNGTLKTTYTDDNGKEFGAYMHLISNGLYGMRVRVFKYYQGASMLMFDATYKKFKKNKQVIEKLKKYGSVIKPLGKEAILVYNPIDNVTGVGTGKYFEYSEKNKNFVKKAEFNWHVTHLGAIERDYANGTVMQIYILQSNDKFASGIIKLSKNNNTTIYPFFIKRKIFKKSFKDIDLSNVTLGVFGEENFVGKAVYDNNSGVLYINKEDEDNVTTDNLTWWVDNETGWLNLNDGTQTRLIAYDNDSKILFVDNHYQNEDYLSSSSLEKWMIAKQFSDNMTGVYVSDGGDNSTITLSFFDNGTGHFTGENSFDFTYAFSQDNMSMQINLGSSSVEFNMLQKNDNGYMLMGTQSNNGIYGDVFSDDWVKQ